jgi:hypothetical protein
VDSNGRRVDSNGIQPDSVCPGPDSNGFHANSICPRVDSVGIDPDSICLRLDSNRPRLDSVCLRVDSSRLKVDSGPLYTEILAFKGVFTNRWPSQKSGSAEWRAASCRELAVAPSDSKTVDNARPSISVVP